MGCCCCGKGGLLILVLLAAVGVYLWTQPKQKIEISENGWYGKGKMGKDDETIKAFKINVPEEVLTDLKTRLSQARISHETLEDSDNFQYGFNSHYLKEVKDYWQNKYDWRKHEATLNAFTQFTTQIEGMKIHFIHSKPAAGYKKIYPLLIVHGWPGNVQEFVKIIPMLNDPKKFGFDYDFAFEVIAPSIPGYGFSDSPKKTGFSQVECARVFHKLMNRLNFKKYYIQGGDWGSMITSNMARMYKNEILALHLNMNGAFPSGIGLVKAILGSFAPKLFFSSPNYQNFNLLDLFKMVMVESGYMHIQATKPDTVGTALNDSPLGLVAYILEKFSSWTNLGYKDLKDGGITKKFTLDEVLTIVTIYWVQGNIVNSQRFYKEFFLDTRNDLLSKEYCEVPTAHSNFGHEPFDKSPEEIMKHSFNLQYRREHPDGGHFAAYELPKTLAGDIFEFIRQQTTPKPKKTDEL
ncbi:unnamed protein product, partial [Mesorhabditis belari]|uniref:Epoxide hydrolase n=1 Tax=Mesorhabditis belari TaxID=2138241 RepID=A0AAF3J1L1_9BILA